MPSKRNGEIPLPSGWEIGHDYDGKVYFIDHNNKKTTWIDPRDRVTKAHSFADCIGQELPYGWEESYDTHIGVYYIDHTTKKNHIEDPRLAWRAVQESMLTEYLHSAQTELEAKKGIMQVKSQRLLLAQEEYNQLSSNFCLCSSMSSLSSSGSGTGKCDPDVLKADVQMAKSRVSKLKHELCQIKHEYASTEAGIHTLAMVKEKMSELTNGYSVQEAQAIVESIRKIEESLRIGEKEKNELMQSLAVLGEDIAAVIDSSSSAASSENILERHSIASQTDLSGEIMPLGARLAELKRLKVEYDSTKASLKRLQHDLAVLEERYNPLAFQVDRDCFALIQEKEQLLKDYKGILYQCRDPFQITALEDRTAQLELDLAQTVEQNSHALSEQMALQEQRQLILNSIKEKICAMVYLESQLKFLSASTLSMSSSSLGSLSTSSKGSLSSLSFTDIYGGGFDQQTVSSCTFSSLQKRVEQLLISNCEADRNYAEKLRLLHVDEDEPSSSTVPSHSVLSLSPRSSLSSLSPPTSSCTGTELVFFKHSIGEIPNIDFGDDQLANLCISASSLTLPNSESELIEQKKNETTFDLESRSGEARTISSAVSDESVAGDSGVYEAYPGSTSSPEYLETPQVQIQLNYRKEEGLLVVVVEKARYLQSLLSSKENKVCIKLQLLPLGAVSFTCCTHLDDNVEHPIFGETFNFPVSARKLPSKTLQINVWSVDNSNDSFEEECVGYAQISLADFSVMSSQSRWYNVLSYAFLKPESLMWEDLSSKSSTLRSIHSCGIPKEESSDESTITSSQTSTLTRNIGSDALRFNLPRTSEGDLDSDEDDEMLSCQDDDDAVEEALENAKDTAVVNDSTDQLIEVADKETNTECVFQPLSCQIRSDNTEKRVASAIQRSKTFTPSHGLKENRTSMDLELDLAAQQHRLQSLRKDIENLKDLKSHLELLKMSHNSSKCPASVLQQVSVEISPEDHRKEKLLRKTSREIYKLRQSRTPRRQMDIMSFREKIAFFLKSNSPSVLPTKEEEQSIVPSNEWTSNLPTKSTGCHKPILLDLLFSPDEQGVQV